MVISYLPSMCILYSITAAAEMSVHMMGGTFHGYTCKQQIDVSIRCQFIIIIIIITDMFKVA